jgi:hypothetical protein
MLDRSARRAVAHATPGSAGVTEVAKAVRSAEIVALRSTTGRAGASPYQ